MTWRKIRILYKKEISELFRDKKTMIMMVLVPLLLYPLLLIGVTLIMNAVMNRMETKEYRVCVETEAVEGFDEADFLAYLKKELAPEGEVEYHFTFMESSNPKEELLAGGLDACIEVCQGEEKPQIEIVSLSSSSNSSTAAGILRRIAGKYGVITPYEIIEKDIATKEENFGTILGSALPFLLIISILMGAMYPAIDLMAGEKERGTLETLLTLPIRNVEMIAAKFLAVSTISVISAVLNLLSMTIVGGYMMQIILGSEEGAELNLVRFLPGLGILFLCIITFAFFISALIMCVTIFAKSFKEANNYLTPVMLVVMFTGYIGFIPDVELTPMTAAIPVVNLCLLVKGMLIFKYTFTTVVITLLSNTAYSAVLIVLLSRLYDSEGVLFQESGVNMQLFTARKHMKKGAVPTVSDAVLVMAFSMLLLFYVGSLLQMKYLLLGVGLTQLLFPAIVFFAVWYTKREIRETLSLKLPGWKSFMGAVLLELGLWEVVTLLSLALNKIMPEDVEMLNQSFDLLLKDVSFLPALFVIAVLPAACEEILFRGYFYSAFRKKANPLWGMLIVGVVFGIYHMSLVKLFTTGILGFVFCYVVYRTGSIFPAMLMHFLNNAISVVVLYFGDNTVVAESVENPSVMEVAVMLATAGILIAIGLKLLSRTCCRKENQVV